MRDSSQRTPTSRRILLSAAAALSPGLAAVALLGGFSPSTPLRWLEVLAVLATGAMLLGGVVILLMLRLARWPQPEAEFEALVQHSERLAVDAERSGDLPHVLPGEGENPETADAGQELFARALRVALEELPLEFHRALEHVAVVVSDAGREHGAYGMYQGDTVARDHFHDRILIFRDTLLRDFGHDPDRLRAGVARTLRHELAHHLGWDERGVRGLGL